MTCREIEDRLPSYIDGAAGAHAPAIATHLATCEACRASLHAQTVAYRVLKSRGAQLSITAPPGLRTRLTAVMADETAKTARKQESPGTLAWSGRLSAFAAALMVVLTLGAILLPAVTIRSTVVLAAQLALDHLKCFTIDGDADGPPLTREAAESTLKNEFDLSVAVPASLADEHLQLMAVRRCLYGDGRAAHLMYRLDGAPVSLFIVPGLARPAEELSLFGHEQLVWTQGDRTYMLVARAGSSPGLARVASYLRNEAK